ncbi:DUF2922 domain-containing protein [Clostridium sp. YIM B02506]|uniref:DUF2922 domain-containing protein n=1 Tax=Clostridium sp. YIM B02506 TaxID=2910680 RepID=UPI001EEE1C62|nr:DUF2922 domain-containing protein [Clostridium sp. YIM B02506]
MSYTLSLSFITSNGSKSSISISGVRPNLTKEEVENLMNLIIDNNFFETKNGSLVAINSAKVVKKEEDTII